MNSSDLQGWQTIACAATLVSAAYISIWIIAYGGRSGTHPDRHWSFQGLRLLRVWAVAAVVAAMVTPAITAMWILAGGAGFPTLLWMLFVLALIPPGLVLWWIERSRNAEPPDATVEGP